MFRHLLFILIITLFFCVNSKGQEKSQLHIDTSIFSWTPFHKHKVVNGIAIGLTAHSWSNGKDTIFAKVNGVNVEAGLMGYYRWNMGNRVWNSRSKKRRW